MPNNSARSTDEEIPIGSNVRTPLDQNALIQEAFRTGRLRWASDLVHGEVILASIGHSGGNSASSDRQCSRAVEVTVGDVVCLIADAFASRTTTA